MAEIAFNEELHEYRVGGERWPSITQILDPLLELDGIPKDALEAAARFGSHVHMATDLWDKGQLDEDALDPHLQPYLEGWKAFLRESGAVVLASELRVAHRLLKVAGTLDKLLRWRFNRGYVTDVKSGADVPWTVGMQTAGYRELLLDQHGPDLARRALIDSQSGVAGLSTTRLCVHLKPEGKYKLHVLDDSRDRNDFISAVNFHRLRSRHGKR